VSLAVIGLLSLLAGLGAVLVTRRRRDHVAPVSD
jgi:LPXTG-motif cell wall-anchored protein